MKQGVVICSWSGGKLWLEQSLRSLEGCKYPITVVINDANNADPSWVEEVQSKYHVVLLPADEWEVGAIKAVTELEIYNEFFFIQDTVEFKDLAVLDILFLQFAGITIQWGYRFQSYLGKYRHEILSQLSFPKIDSKHQAIQWELQFIDMYKDYDRKVHELFPDFADRNGHQEEHLGRNNLKIENEYLIKWKGTWR